MEFSKNIENGRDAHSFRGTGVPPVCPAPFHRTAFQQRTSDQRMNADWMIKRPYPIYIHPLEFNQPAVGLNRGLTAE